MDYILTKVLEKISGSIIVRFDGRDYKYDNGEEALSFRGNGGKFLILNSIEVVKGELIVSVEESKYAPLDMNEKWIAEFYQQYGRYPNPFDGA